METRIHVRIAAFIFHYQISWDGVCGWSCDSDYRGLKKRIMAIKSAQQSGNDLHLTQSVSSDSDHERLPSSSRASKWTDVFNRRENQGENAGGHRAADVQDERQKQEPKQEPETAREQIELNEVKTGEDVPNVGAEKTTPAPGDDDSPTAKQQSGVVILDFIPFSPRSRRSSAAPRGSQLLDKLRRRSSRCDYLFLSTLCSGSMVLPSHSVIYSTYSSTHTFSNS